MSTQKLTRRAALLGLSAAFSLGHVSVALGAAPTQNRFVVILLRGALDGLSAVQPYGDPAFRPLRDKLALAPPGTDGGVLDLGGFYGLHPSLRNFHQMYSANEALVVHAVAGHYRSRSHFEAQDYLESGADQRLTSGWLNRAVAAMAAPSGHDLALTMGLSAPLLLRGPAHVQAWAPAHFGQEPSEDVYTRLLRLAAHDPIVGPSLREALQQRDPSLAGATPAADGMPGDAMMAGAKPAKGAVLLAGAAGKMLAAPDGPRVAVLELNGWDTHAAQIPRLQAALGQLDDVLGALRAGLGDQWSRTVILAVTEFGRTARMNGTGGTDHGTGGVALLAGGAVAGGRVRADWPGLGEGRLFENRDLMPTADVRAIAKGVLSAHLGLGGDALAAAFPGSFTAPPMAGLVRT
jgi:uncharacterized protein (DUF1501 family)